MWDFSSQEAAHHSLFGGWMRNNLPPYAYTHTQYPQLLVIAATEGIREFELSLKDFIGISTHPTMTAFTANNMKTEDGTCWFEFAGIKISYTSTKEN